MSQEVEQIKDRLDIVDIIQEYLPLKKSGSNFKGLCPFHQEKSPSFMASQTKQIWHCFGCHKGGDIFSFVQEIEGIEFFEVLKLLGDKAGVKIERKNKQGAGKKQNSLEILEVCTEFFHKLLKDHPKAEKAREYVKKRKLTDETVKDFQIGYSPDAWDVLLKFLEKRGFTRQQIIETGMLVVNQEKGSVYDRFRDRLMIPLRDVYGNVVGFTARTMKADEPGGKYINTPQTATYDKSRTVFGLSNAKKAIKDSGHAVIVEGNMDVISSHQVGVKQVVAVSGTALTEPQLGLLKRFTQTLIFAFDADSAGFMAMRRGVELALSLGFEVKVLSLPAGKDPDDYIQEGVELWQKAISEALPVVEVILQKSLEKNDATSAQGKKVVAKDVLSLLRFLPSPIEQDHYIQKLASAIQVSEHSLREAFKGSAVKSGQNQEKQPASSPSQPPKLSKEEIVSKEFLSLLLLNPSFIQECDLPEEGIENASLKELYKNLKLFYSQNQDAAENQHTLESFSKKLDTQLQTLLTHLQLFADKSFAELQDSEQKAALLARLKFLKQRYLSRQLQRVQTSLQDAEKSNNMTAIRSLSEEFHKLTSDLQSLN